VLKVADKAFNILATAELAIDKDDKSCLDDANSTNVGKTIKKVQAQTTVMTAQSKPRHLLMLLKMIGSKMKKLR